MNKSGLSFELKEYVKVIKLTNAQAHNVITTYFPKISMKEYEFVASILTRRCNVQVDRTNPAAITIYSNKGIYPYYKDKCNTGRLIIMAAITARNYSHFYNNLEKKFKRVPSKVVKKV